MGPGAVQKHSGQEFPLRRLGIVVAITAEARSLVRKSRLKSNLISLSGETLVQLSGIGPQRAGEAARGLLRNGATALLSWGSAGGLVSGLVPGSLVLPDNVIGADLSRYSTDAVWHRRLLDRLKDSFDLHQGSLAESGIPLENSLEKKILFERTGAIAVDMESVAVAKAAQEGGVPFMAIRAVADTANTTLPQTALRAIDAFGELNLLAFLTGFVSHPAELFDTIRLGRKFRAAHVTLSEVAKLAGNQLLVPP